MIKVSVIIPVYNQEELIKRCIKSIPDRENIEVIVVNDCSTDNTEQTVKDIMKTRSIRLFKTEQNSGPGIAKNIGLDHARGEYIIFVDSDDYVYAPAFIYMMTHELDGTDYVWYKKERNDGYTWAKGGGTCQFIRRDCIGKVKHESFLVGEDTQFHKRIRMANPNLTEKFIDIVLYHYNYPREGSLAWNRKHGLTEAKKIYGGEN